MYNAHVMGEVQLHVRTCICTPYPYLGNGLTDCAEIWCVVREPLDRRFTEVDGGVQLHVSTPFSYLGNGFTD